MGYALWRPERLAEKLLHIRLALGLSQSALLTALGMADEMSYTRISGFERGKGHVPLAVLVEYARLAGVHLERIADDRLDLPKELPDTVSYDAWNLPHPKRRTS